MEVTTAISVIETESVTTEIITEFETFPVIGEIEVTETTTVTTTISADLSSLAEIDVGLLNSTLYLVSSFIIASLFFFVFKGVYRLFNMFF
ncbi:MAG: hypothetical protein K2N49_00160 [Ruminococcus sp.]|nr:hypothetical protein [Ruminococcus sp.]MDE5763529.1 hypothetical protein [Ruminococcus sp.]MDE7225272.1 hypothetical protein [Ruminococcus sp.]